MAHQLGRTGRARRADRRGGGLFALPVNAFDWVFGRAAYLIVGYGFHPCRALIWLAALSLLTAFFGDDGLKLRQHGPKQRSGRCNPGLARDTDA